jgi:rubrerythrin
MRPQRNLTTPDQILRAALDREKESRDFYAAIAASCSVDYVKELLEKLENEEEKHMHMIQAMIERLDAGRDIV